MEFETLTYRVEDKIAWIQLHRPNNYNSINSVMSRELPVMWNHFKNDDSAVVAVLSGYGDKTFCTGADLEDMPQTDLPGREATLDSILWSSHQNKVWKPVICAVNGTVVGGGLHFVADADIVIASENAKFLDTHVKVGLIAGLEMISLTHRMPMESVLRLALTGGSERFSAQQAKELGLVGEVVPADQLLQRAKEIADSIKIHSPSALQRTKKVIWKSLEMNLNESFDYCWERILDQNEHDDVKEGVAAFVERREPQWQAHREDD